MLCGDRPLRSTDKVAKAGSWLVATLKLYDSELSDHDPILQRQTPNLERLEELWNFLAIWLWIYGGTCCRNLSRREIADALGRCILCLKLSVQVSFPRSSSASHSSNKQKLATNLRDSMVWMNSCCEQDGQGYMCSGYVHA